jgi:hypothetical protein
MAAGMDTMTDTPTEADTLTVMVTSIIVRVAAIVITMRTFGMEPIIVTIVAQGTSDGTIDRGCRPMANSAAVPARRGL